MLRQSMLMTGASGFLGRHMLPALKQHYDVTACGRSAANDIRVDLSTSVPELPRRYDIVVHAAGKAHSRPRNEHQAAEYERVNVGGTRHLCQALEQAGVPEALVFISSVAVYGCSEGKMIDESHSLEPVTHYASSKLAAERLLEDWCGKHGVVLTILRPALIMGSDAPGNLESMRRAIAAHRFMTIGKADARKSVLSVTDLANIIPLVANIGGTYNVCSDEHPTFGEIAAHVARSIGRPSPAHLPMYLAKPAARIGDCLRRIGIRMPFDSEVLAKSTRPLTFDNSKLKKATGWQPSRAL